MHATQKCGVDDPRGPVVAMQNVVEDPQVLDESTRLSASAVDIGK